MICIVNVLRSARAAHKSSSRLMEVDGIWNLYATGSGVIIARSGIKNSVLVQNVHQMSSECMVVKLSEHLANNWPSVWGEKPKPRVAASKL